MPINLKQEENINKKDATRVSINYPILNNKPYLRRDVLTDLGGSPDMDKRTSSERNKDYLYNPLNKEKLLNRSKQLGKMIRPIAASAAIATGAIGPASAASFGGAAKLAARGAMQGLGFGQLGMGTGSTTNDITYGIAGELAGPLINEVPKISSMISSSIKPLVKSPAKTINDYGKRTVINTLDAISKRTNNKMVKNLLDGNQKNSLENLKYNYREYKHLTNPHLMDRSLKGRLPTEPNAYEYFEAQGAAHRRAINAVEKYNSGESYEDWADRLVGHPFSKVKRSYLQNNPEAWIKKYGNKYIQQFQNPNITSKRIDEKTIEVKFEPDNNDKYITFGQTDHTGMKNTGRIKNLKTNEVFEEELPPFYKLENVPEDIARDRAEDYLKNKSLIQGTYRITYPNAHGGSPKFHYTPFKPKTITDNRQKFMSDKSIQVLNENNEYIQSLIPGMKPFGSTELVKNKFLPHHVTHDLDYITTDEALPFIENFKISSGQQAKYGKTIELNGEPIDINIINTGKDGLAEGGLAEEIFRQIDPKTYSKELEKTINNNSYGIKIPYTPKQLLEKYNPLTKSLVDAFESSKDKHMSRFSLIAENGDPKLLLQAQERKSAAMLNGEVYNVPNEIDLSDVNTNMEVLKNINYQGTNPQIIAESPNRMRLILNEYYHGNSIISRGVDADDLSVGKEAILKYKPLGGSQNAVNGAGRNAVVGGDSGHGQIYGNAQINLFENESPKNAMDVFNIINKKTSSKYEFNQDMTKKISNIFERYGHRDFEPKNSTDIAIELTKNKYPIAQKNISNEVGDIIPMNIQEGNRYRSGIYTSIFKDFPDNSPLLYGDRKRFNTELTRSTGLRFRQPPNKKQWNIQEVDFPTEVVQQIPGRSAEATDQLLQYAYSYKKQLQDKYRENIFKKTPQYKEYNRLSDIEKRYNNIRIQKIDLNEIQNIKNKINRIKTASEVAGVIGLGAGATYGMQYIPEDFKSKIIRKKPKQIINKK